MKRSAIIKFIRTMNGNMKTLVIGVFSLLVSNFALSADQYVAGLTITKLTAQRFHNSPSNSWAGIYVFYSGGSAAFTNGTAGEYNCAYPDRLTLNKNDSIGYNEMLDFLMIALVTGRKVAIEIDRDTCGVHYTNNYYYHQIQSVTLMPPS